MTRNLKVTLAAFCAALQSAFAFNPIHESSYNIEPRGMFSAPATLSPAGRIDSRNTEVWAVPVSIALKPNKEVELGAGIKTNWGGGDDHVPHMVFGVKFLTPGGTTFQADLLVPANSSGGKGFSLGSHHRFGYGSIFSSRLALRAGFMEALVEDDALLAFETGFYPTLALGRGISLELGMIGSSQTENFERNLAMDLQPGLIVPLAKGSSLQVSVALGLAGNRKEELSTQVLLNYGF